MRAHLLVLVSLLAVALAGCHTPDEPVATGHLFAAFTVPPGSARPVPMESCSELLVTLNDRALDEAETALALAVEGQHWGRGGVVFDAMPFAQRGVAETAAGGSLAVPSQPAAPSARDADVTGTNNQEAGAEEADVLKTDGEWTYVLQGHYVYILRSDRVGDLTEHARIALNNTSWGGMLLLEPRDPDDPADDRLIIIRQGWDQRSFEQALSSLRSWGGRSITHIQVLDLGNRSAPDVVDELRIDGHLLGARLINGHAYVVVQDNERDLQLRTGVHPTEEELQARGLTWESYWNLKDDVRKALWQSVASAARTDNADLVANATLADHLPRIQRTLADGQTVELPFTENACRRFLATENTTGRSISTIAAIATDADVVQSRFTQLVGGGSILYGTPGGLVLASPTHAPWWFWGRADVDEATDLQWFDVDGLDVSLRATGRIPGVVQDSFGIDLFDGQLRVATTTGQWGRWWVQDPPPMLNHIAVLQETAGQLVPMGAIGGIAPGERIWSARFTDDRAYIITFEQVDPLWIIDLSEPRTPRILGELEIPGVSTYIHPLSDDLLLTIGYGAGEGGRGLDWSKIEVSLFDIRDTANPTRADLLAITPSEGWAHSGATREHKAFTYWDKLGMLAVPVSWSQSYDYGAAHHVGLRLINVDTANRTLSIHGDVDQDSLVDAEAQHWRGDVERSYFLGLPGTTHVSVYAMSSMGMTAHDLDTLELQAKVAFENEHGYIMY